MPDPYTTTVTVKATSQNLTVLETVKQELGITDINSDDLLLRYIAEQSDVVNGYCGRKFSKETIVDSFNVDTGTCFPLILSRKPISSITAIVEISTTLDQSNYEIDLIGGRVWRLDGGLHSWWPVGKIIVTYTGGYELVTELPSAVERATIVLIKQAWFSRTRDPKAKSETVEGIGSIDFWVGASSGEYGINSEAAELLSPYRTIYV